MQAVHARLVAMEQAEKIVLEDMQSRGRPRSRRGTGGGDKPGATPRGVYGFMLTPAVGR